MWLATVPNDYGGADFAGVSSRMDAELKAYLDHLRDTIAAQFEALESRMMARFEAADHHAGRMDARFDSMHREFSEKFISVDERFKTLELRVEQSENRLSGKMDQVRGEVSVLSTRVGGMDERLGKVEAAVLTVSRRVDDLSDDIRQRFRFAR